MIGLGLFLTGAEDAEGEQEDEGDGGSGGDLAVIEAEALPGGEGLFYRVGHLDGVFLDKGVGVGAVAPSVLVDGVPAVAVAVDGVALLPLAYVDAVVGEDAVFLDEGVGIRDVLGLDGLDGHVLDGLAAGEEGDEQAYEDAPSEAGEDVPEREAVGLVGFLFHGCGVLDFFGGGGAGRSGFTITRFLCSWARC